MNTVPFSRFCRRGLLPLLGAAILASQSFVWALDQSSANSLADFLLAQSGRTHGMCAVARCADGTLPLALLNKSEMVVHAIDASRANVEATLSLAEPTGLVGRRLYAEKGITSSLPYTTNYLDLLVITGLTDSDLSGVSLAEIVRGICPDGGQAWVGRASAEGAGLTEAALRTWAGSSPNVTVTSNAQGAWAKVTKGKPAGMDEWTHSFHRPDNNPASDDQVLTFPHIDQYRLKPYHPARGGSIVAGGGRLYEVFRHGAGWTFNDQILRAFNVYNGRQLWERNLDEDANEHPITGSFMVATDDHLYIIMQGSVLQLNGNTGARVRSIDFSSTEHVKWIAQSGSLLYALVGDTALDSVVSEHLKHRRLFRYGTSIRTYNITTNTMGWNHNESHKIDAREIGIVDGKLYYYASSSGFVCLNAATGAVEWEKRDPSIVALLEDEEEFTWTVEEKPGLICSPHGLFISSSDDNNLCAFSAANGDHLWTDSRSACNVAIWNNILFAKNSAASGKNVETNTMSAYEDANVGKGCGPFSVSPNAIYGQAGGFCHDLTSNTVRELRSYKSGCDNPPFVSNGLLIVGPTVCTCNNFERGTIVKGSAGDLTLDIDATVAERLEQGPAFGDVSRTIVPEDNDWPTHRADNARTGGVASTAATGANQMWHYTPPSPYPVVFDNVRANYNREEEPTPPVIAGNHVFWGGTDGYIRCYDGGQGREVWKYATGGRIYATPTVWNGCVYVGSGDGYAYCLEAHTGRLVWRFRAAPYERRINLYGHLASPWPVLTGVMVHDNKAFLAAGLEGHGTHVYALNALNGSIVWQNNGTGSCYHPDSRIGLVPGGYMTVAGDKLYVKSYNGRPGAFDVADEVCL